MSVATAMFVLGAGVPACLITMTSLGVSDLPPNKVANGSGLQSFIRIMCMATGASLTSTYWESATKENRANLVSIIDPTMTRSEEHTSELQSLMRTPYAVFCLKKKKNRRHYTTTRHS